MPSFLTTLSQVDQSKVWTVCMLNQCSIHNLQPNTGTCHQCNAGKNNITRKQEACASYCFDNSGELEGTGKDGTQEFLVGNLNRSSHLSVLLAENVRQTLEKNARLDESVKTETLLPLRVVAVKQALDEVWRQTVTHL